ncbi:MAG: PilN domain-containing protein [Myxococcota bacterium]|jgi:type IV pilus assembly protein PilN
MIEINLLPHRESRRLADLRQSVALLALGLVIAGGGIFFAASSVVGELKRAQTNVRQLEAAIEQFKPQQEQVASFKKQRNQLEDKLDVIKSLAKARTGPVKLFDELADLAPERLWLKSLSTKGDQVTLEGSSLDTGIVADFLRSLNESKFFSNVDLKNTKGGKEVDGVKLVDFKVSADFMKAKAAAVAKKTDAKGKG